MNKIKNQNIEIIGILGYIQNIRNGNIKKMKKKSCTTSGCSGQVSTLAADPSVMPLRNINKLKWKVITITYATPNALPPQADTRK